MIKMSKEILEEYKVSLDVVACLPEFNQFLTLPKDKQEALICLLKEKFIEKELSFSYFVFLLEVLGVNFYTQGYLQSAVTCHRIQKLIDPNHPSTKRLKKYLEPTFFSKIFQKLFG